MEKQAWPEEVLIPGIHGRTNLISSNKHFIGGKIANVFMNLKNLLNIKTFCEIVSEGWFDFGNKISVKYFAFNPKILCPGKICKLSKNVI